MIWMNYDQEWCGTCNATYTCGMDCRNYNGPPAGAYGTGTSTLGPGEEGCECWCTICWPGSGDPTEGNGCPICSVGEHTKVENGICTCVPDYEN